MCNKQTEIHIVVQPDREREKLETKIQADITICINFSERNCTFKWPSMCGFLIVFNQLIKTSKISKLHFVKICFLKMPCLFLIYCFRINNKTFFLFYSMSQIWAWQKIEKKNPKNEPKTEMPGNCFFHDLRVTFENIYSCFEDFYNEDDIFIFSRNVRKSSAQKYYEILTIYEYE